MRLTDLSRRLDRLEARRGTDRIASVVNLAGHPPETVAQAVRDPRPWIADGRARRAGPTLYLLAPVLTVAEWSARYAPSHERPTCA